MKNNTHSVWKKVKIKELLDYERPDKYIVESERYVNQGVPVLTANKSFILGYTNENNGIYEKIPAIIFDDFTTNSKYVDFPFKVKSSAIKILKSKNLNVDLRFIFEKIKSINFPTGNHKRYYISQYQNMEVAIPPLSVQKKIVKILLSADAAIQKTDQIIQKAEVLKKGLLINLISNYLNNKIAKQWEIKQLNQVCDLITDGKHGDCKNQTESGYFFISSKDVHDGIIDYTNSRQITKTDFEEADKRTQLGVGDLVMTNSGTIGRMAISQNDPRTRRTTFQKSVAIIKPKKQVISSTYLQYYFLSVLRSLQSTSNGSAQKNLLLKDMRSLLIPVPEIGVQNEIVSVLFAVDQKIIIENTKKEKLLILKRGLVQDIFSQKVQII